MEKELELILPLVSIALQVLELKHSIHMQEGNWSLDCLLTAFDVHGLSETHACIKWVDHFG
jgi:hypothetical protein